MCDRYGGPPAGTTAAEAIASSVNVLSLIFAQIYFPSFSNGLKENARFLGFEWTDPSAVGLQSIVWRDRWEESADVALQQQLIAYNTDDCAALSLIARTLNQIAGREVGTDDTSFSTVTMIDANALQENQNAKWRPFRSPILDLETINLAARWDYQQDRVFVRSGRASRKTPLQSKRRQAARSPQKIIILAAPGACPKCQKKSPNKSTSPVKDRARSCFWQGQHQTKSYPIRDSNLFLPKLRLRVWTERIAPAWSKMGLEHSCLLCLPHGGFVYSATDCPTQHEQTVWLSFDAKFIERIQNKSVGDLLRYQGKNS